jgi:hypothetical protein
MEKEKKMELLTRRNTLRDTRWVVVEEVAEVLGVSAWNINFEGNWREELQVLYNERVIALTMEVAELEEQIGFMRGLIKN